MVPPAIKCPKNHDVERDGVDRKMFAGYFRIFAHGDVARIGCERRFF